MDFDMKFSSDEALCSDSDRRGSSSFRVQRTKSHPQLIEEKLIFSKIVHPFPFTGVRS